MSIPRTKPKPTFKDTARIKDVYLQITCADLLQQNYATLRDVTQMYQIYLLAQSRLEVLVRGLLTSLCY